MTSAGNPPGFWRLPLRTRGLPGRVNSYLVGHRETLLVDPGSDFEGELDRLRQRVWILLGSGCVLRAVLLTHHHPDHTAGAFILSEELGVPIAAHPATLERLPRARRPRWLLALEAGSRLQLGGELDLQVLHTPGHAAGHLCLFEPRHRVLLGGDMVPGTGTTLVDPDEGDMGVYLASLRELAALDPEVLLPGHGPARREARRLVEELIAHRLWREQAVLDALGKRPRGLAEITSRAYDLERGGLALLRWPLALRSTLAHLHKLQAEGRAVSAKSNLWVRQG